MKELQLGSCVSYVSRNGIPHYYFVITEPKGDPLGAVAVNITDYDNCSDKTVVLVDGHSAIRKKSVVNYREATYWDVKKIENEINDGEKQTMLHYKEPVCSEALLKALQDGLLNSKHTPEPFRRFCAKEFAK